MWPGRSRVMGGASWRSILGANLVELWVADKGVVLSGADVTSWTGVIRGLVLAPRDSVSRPTYGADSANFHARAVVQMARGNQGNLNWSGTAIGSSTDTGCHIWVGRTRTDPSGSDYDMISTSWGPNGNIDSLIQQNAAVGYHGIQWNDYIGGAGSTNIYTFPYNTNITAPMMFEGSRTTAQLPTVYINGSQYAQYATPIAGKIGAFNQLQLGSNRPYSRQCDMSFAAFAYCSNAPTDVQRAALYQLAQTDWL